MAEARQGPRHAGYAIAEARKGPRHAATSSRSASERQTDGWPPFFMAIDSAASDCNRATCCPLQSAEHKARTLSANFLSVRAEHTPQRAPDTEIMTFFVWKGVKKKKRDRTLTAPIDSRRAFQPTKQKKEIEEPTSCHLCDELSRLRPLLRTIQANVGPIAALNKDGLTCTHRMFGPVGRASDQKPMATHRTQAATPGICSVYIHRAAQMSEHRGAQS